jgi:hypothetical protein
MDARDLVCHLADAESRRVRPITDDDELASIAECGGALPYFTIFRRDGRLEVGGHGHEGHDNEGRMAFVCDFLRTRVLPAVSQSNVTGSYRLELHDSYSYLPRRAEYDNALSFGRAKGARERVALFPDPYQMGDFGGMLSVRDVVDWSNKQPTLFFAGTTTGDRSPAANERIRACVWSLRHAEEAKMYITNVAQMDAAHAVSAVPDLRRVFRAPLAIEAHHAFRYQVNIAGNTACWSRVPMILGSRCLMVNLRQRDVTWYGPALREGTHFVEARDFEELLQRRRECEARGDAWCRQMTASANRFVGDFLGSTQAAEYIARLLESAAERSRA